MYDDEPLFHPRFDHALRGLPGAYGERGADRLRHLVFLDGRLVDAWTEPAEGSHYLRFAEPPPVAMLPPAPPHEQVLGWLDAVVGGRSALLDLDDVPLEAAERDGDDPSAADDPARDGIDDLLERVSLEVFADGEVHLAGRHVLARICQHEPSLLRRRSVPQVAAGIVWVVGRANGLFGPPPGVRHKEVQRVLWVKQPLSALGEPVLRVLRPFGPPPERPAPLHPPLPALLPTGDPRVLVSQTRGRLVLLRDRALAADRRHAADEAAKAATPAPAVRDARS